MQLHPDTSALVLIDLQNGIVSMPLSPRSGTEVAEASKTVAERFRATGAPVVLVNVSYASDYADAPSAQVDNPTPRPAGGLPAVWSELVEGLAQPADLRITKHQWGAFHGTELDLQLRRRGIRTIVLAGIATNFGVESTARFAWEYGYQVVVLEDLCSSFSAELHKVSAEVILPRISHVRQSADISFTKTA